MYILQLLTGILFTLLGGAGGYLYYVRHNNAFLAAMGLFLLIAVSCYLLALGTKRRNKKDPIIPESEEMEYEEEDYDYESEEAGDPEEFAEDSEEAAYEEYEEYDPDTEDYQDEYPYDEYPYDEETEEAYIEEEAEETDLAEEYEEPEAMDFSPFYLAYIKDLLPIQQEIIHSNTSAYLEEQPIEEMSTEELESAIERTQVALNALTRLRMFCETRGTGGPEYYEEAMERYESDPYFMTLEMLNEQMNALRNNYDQRQGTDSPVDIEEDSFSAFLNEEFSAEEPAAEPFYEETAREENETEDVTEENDAAEEDDTIAENDVTEEESMDAAEPAEEELPAEPESAETEPEFSEEEAAFEESVDEPEISLEAMIEEDWLEEALTEEPVYIHPFEEAVSESSESGEESAAEEEIVSDEEMEEAYSDETAGENDEADEPSFEELSAFEQLDIDENDMESRILRVIGSNEGIHPNDLIHSFEPSLKKQVKKALLNLLDDEIIEKKRVGFSHGLFLVPYEQKEEEEGENENTEE